jgi:hypothetical protein
VEPIAECLAEFFLGLDFFGQHAAMRGSKAPDEVYALRARGGAQVDFDDVRDGRERFAPIVRGEVVERDQVPRVLQPPAGGDDDIIDFDAFKNLDHR